MALHGSEANTSADLLGLTECSTFIISANGIKHNLPNKRLLARLKARYPDQNFQVYLTHSNAVTSSILAVDQPLDGLEIFFPESGQTFFQYYLMNRIDPFIVRISTAEGGLGPGSILLLKTAPDKAYILTALHILKGQDHLPLAAKTGLQLTFYQSESYKLQETDDWLTGDNIVTEDLAVLIIPRSAIPENYRREHTPASHCA